MRICDLTDFRTRQCVKSVFLFGVSMKPLFTFSTSIGITVQVVTEINDVPLRGLFLLEIDPNCIANDVILSLTSFDGSPEDAELKAMDMCMEIEMMALEMSRERTKDWFPVPEDVQYVDFCSEDADLAELTAFEESTLLTDENNQPGLRF